MKPLNPLVEALVSSLDENLREAFEERAGILEFEASHSRELAECLALLMVIRQFPLAVSEVVPQVRRRNGHDEYLLRHTQTPVEGRPLDLVTLVHQWGGIAVLVPIEPPKN